MAHRSMLPQSFSTHIAHSDRKLMSGVYCLSLLNGLLEPEIKSRLTVAQICTNTWLDGFQLQTGSQSDCPSENTHQLALQSAAAVFNISRHQVLESVKRRAYNNIAGAYNILIHKKRLLKELEPCGEASSSDRRARVQWSNRHVSLSPSQDSRNLSVVVSTDEYPRRPIPSPPNYSHLKRHWKQTTTIASVPDTVVNADCSWQKTCANKPPAELVWRAVSSSSNVSGRSRCRSDDSRHVCSSKTPVKMTNSQNTPCRNVAQSDKDENRLQISEQENSQMRDEERYDNRKKLGNKNPPRSHLSAKQHRAERVQNLHQLENNFSSDENEISASFHRTSLQHEPSRHRYSERTPNEKSNTDDKSNYKYLHQQKRETPSNSIEIHQPSKPLQAKHRTSDKTGLHRMIPRKPPPCDAMTIKRCQSESLALQRKSLLPAFSNSSKSPSDVRKRPKHSASSGIPTHSSYHGAPKVEEEKKTDTKFQRAHRSMENTGDSPRDKNKVHDQHIDLPTKSNRVVSYGRTGVTEKKTKISSSYRTCHKV